MGWFAFLTYTAYILFKLLTRKNYYCFYHFLNKERKTKAWIDSGYTKQNEGEYGKRENSFWFWGSGWDVRGNALWAEPGKMARNKNRRITSQLKELWTHVSPEDS